MRKSLVTAACLSGAVAFTIVASPAHAIPTDHGPTAAATRAGIVKPGEAYAGWKATGTQPLTRSVTPTLASGQTLGIDVSSHQGNVSWSSQWGAGVRWAYSKATEGTSYTNPYFPQQYNGSYNVGMIRGAYHFALPDTSTGAAQADHFAAHGGGWSKDGKTLPGMLDMEYNPYGATCYGKSASSMVSWIKSFLAEYKAKTGRDAVIYTNYDWWSRCTGNSTAFNQTNPLWVARYSSSPGTLPGGWPYYTIWQYTSSPIDKDWFNGDITRVKALANG
ncbi:hydrolase [Flexivirga endophytica]|uniref:lysozyme n=1 Tax=Flexivirga endophytica TaxID=1849103 RepID=A0A916T2Y4_9MICO|nr:lysozyme [Flexivirga endophytica]GGB26504.1 hydrolase [Flexivirga endophytica]GHB55001.1 hydrolase [Flexivirga endophytica]